MTRPALLDDYALFFIGLLVADHGRRRAALVWLLSAAGEPPARVLHAAAAGRWAAPPWSPATHFASFFLGLEILSVSLYALIAYPRRAAEFVEAGVKYLVLAAATAAFLLFGMALVYAEPAP